MTVSYRTEAIGGSFVEAYADAVDLWLRHRPQSLTVRVTDPVSEPSAVPNIRDPQFNTWRRALRLGDQFSSIEDVSLSKTSPLAGGDTVAHWVEDRVIEQLDGGYWKQSGRAIEECIDEGLKGYPGNRRNALIANLFDENDRQRAMRAPQVKGLPCVSHLQFTTDFGTLGLCTTLRSQFFGLKGLGNLVASGALLAYAARQADYEVGEVREEVHNVTTHDEENVRKIYRRLQESDRDGDPVEV